MVYSSASPPPLALPSQSPSSSLPNPLRYQPPFGGNPSDTLSGTGGRPGDAPQMTFNRDGLISVKDGSGGDVFLTLRDSAQNLMRCLQITAVGGAQVVQPAAVSGCT
jgi:hypothetical protein